MFKTKNSISSENRSFIKQLAAITITATIQNVAINIMAVIDSSMVGNLGDLNIAALGASSKAMLVLNLIVYGISSGSVIFAAMYWGNKDMKNLHQAVGTCLKYVSAISLMMAVLTFFLPGPILHIFTNDTRIIELGIPYLQIVSFGYLAYSITTALTFLMRSIGRPAITMVTSLISVSLNIFFDWALIFGKLGFPNMGLRGASAAYLISKVVECLINLSCIFIFKLPIRISFRDLIVTSREYAHTFKRIVVPVIGNELFWGIGSTVYFAVYGHMSSGALVVMTVTTNIETLVNMLFMSLAYAGAVIMGNEMGASQNGSNRLELYNKRFLRIAVVAGFVETVALLFFTPFLRQMYHLNEALFGALLINMVLMAVSLPIKSYNFMNIEGIFRSGGDTKYIFLVDSGSVWYIGIPAVIIFGLVLHLPIYFVYLGTLLIEIFKLFMNFRRNRSKKWMKVRVENSSADPVVSAD